MDLLPYLRWPFLRTPRRGFLALVGLGASLSVGSAQELVFAPYLVQSVSADECAPAVRPFPSMPIAPNFMPLAPSAPATSPTPPTAVPSATPQTPTGPPAPKTESAAPAAAQPNAP